MKFDLYVKQVTQLLIDRPETANLDVITSKDDEGNGFNQVHYQPYLGHFDGEDFTGENVDEDIRQKSNAVCVN